VHQVGQFVPASLDQFAPAKPGHIKPANLDQFDRRMHFIAGTTFLLLKLFSTTLMHEKAGSGYLDFCCFPRFSLSFAFSCRHRIHDS
ncbi:hypothetical protein, partial [Paracnuella aquatica]|uniref:hypothetical protein n=1 Tax=Paracnuella aquatica TaxID=2268757 RepID=UPI0019D4BE26